MPYYVSDVTPDYSAALGLLQHLSTEELKQLLNNDERLESMIKDLQQVKTTESEKEMLLARNKSIAEFNLTRKPQLMESRTHLAALYTEAIEIKQEVEQKMQKLNDLNRQTSLDATLAVLQTAVAETEEDSEILADSFLTGDISVESFIEQFLDKRKLAHLRRVKTEKMTELISQQPSRPSRPSQPAPYPSRPAPHPPPGPNLPYAYPHPNPLNSAGSMPTPYPQPSRQTPYPIGPSSGRMPMPNFR